MEDQAAHVVGQIDQYNFGLGALDADGADEQTHAGDLLVMDNLAVRHSRSHVAVDGPKWPLLAVRLSMQEPQPAKEMINIRPRPIPVKMIAGISAFD